MTSTLSGASLVVRRLGRHSVRRPAIAFVLPTVMPLGLVVFISQLYGAMATRPGYPTADLLAWMGPGIVFLAATMGGGFAGTSLVIDARSGFLDRLRLLPLSTRSIIVGCLVFEGLRVVPVAMVLLAVAGAFGLHLPGPAGIAVVIALAALWSAAWNAMFLLAAIRTRDPQLPLVLLPLFLPFFLGSTILVPRALLPGYVRAVVDANPLDRFVVAARPLFSGDATEPAAIAVAVLIAVGLIGVLGGLAARQFARMTAP